MQNAFYYEPRNNAGIPACARMSQGRVVHGWTLAAYACRSKLAEGYWRKPNCKMRLAERFVIAFRVITRSIRLANGSKLAKGCWRKHPLAIPVRRSGAAAALVIPLYL